MIFKMIRLRQLQLMTKVRFLLVILVIAMNISGNFGSSQKGCCEEIHLQSTKHGNTQKQALGWYDQDLHTKFDDPMYKINGTGNSWVIVFDSSRGWEVHKGVRDPNDIKAPGYIRFNCTAPCPGECTNDDANPWLYLADEYYPDDTMSLTCKPVDCVWAPWQNSNCSLPCGNGKVTRTRIKKVAEKYGGICLDQRKTKQEDCIIEECPGNEILTFLTKHVVVISASAAGGFCVVAGISAIYFLRKKKFACAGQAKTENSIEEDSDSNYDMADFTDMQNNEFRTCDRNENRESPDIIPSSVNASRNTEDVVVIENPYYDIGESVTDFNVVQRNENPYYGY